MAFPFFVGNPVVQSSLDWVAEPPPAQARDTHALRFRLNKFGAVSTNAYSGLLFFRPPGTGSGPVGVTPGLDGFGGLLATKDVCQKVVANAPAAELVKVFIGFRRRQSGPAAVFATLTFMDGDLLQLPIQTSAEVVEFSNVAMEGAGEGVINMDPPQGWSLSLGRTTALLGRP